ncbi:hypothetical protein C8N35_111118 [Breoghania corrubedonensis]|uniref:Uncharacterized protein n=1 Tax=Breoghania corrubedonensis TaxID=665038 RepID=A0A2T5UYS1_9HYPH|nr:hypothetical protein [Breoghania corrubedonensis]PTW56655.1 hypothetical protein C8N35_111118 [Breoghania corrubedonensis]
MTEDDGPEEPFDPGIDILAGLTAVILLSVIAILPMANLAKSRIAEIGRVMERLLREGPDATGNAARLLVIARHDGATVSGPEPAFVSLDDILDNQPLWSRILASSRKDEVPVLFIEESGQEAAFLLETLFSRAGLSTISRVFLDGACGFFKERYKPGQCDFGAGRTRLTGDDDAQ